MRRVLVIGLDSATPQFVFGPKRFDLPHMQRLMSAGCWGRLESCHPPITVPAWACMMSGKDPGTLGCYGFRNRKDHSYDGMVTAGSATIREPRAWDILSNQGRRVVVLGVPQTYPLKPVNGCMLAGFPAPDKGAEYAYPRSLKQELESAVGGHIVDVADFRTEQKDRLLGDVYALMRNRFAVARHLLENKPWDFFMLVEMGVDRIHHAFWKYCDPSHPKYEPGNPYANVIRDYYVALDAEIGGLLAMVGEETGVLVVSDHGAKAMLGGICMNQWLIQEGLLHVRDDLRARKRIEDCDIDWSRTRVWGSGGYYGRLFINVQGREPQGIVPAAEYESFRDSLIEKIETMPGPDGRPLGNRAHKPANLYRTVNGIAPDLIVYFGNLDWRSVGTVGFESIYTFENDTGPDDANHDFHGIFIMDDRRGRGGEEMSGVQLMDIAPTVLELLGIAPPSDMQGRTIGH